MILGKVTGPIRKYEKLSIPADILAKVRREVSREAASHGCHESAGQSASRNPRSALVLLSARSISNPERQLPNAIHMSYISAPRTEVIRKYYGAGRTIEFEIGSRFAAVVRVQR